MIDVELEFPPNISKEEETALRYFLKEMTPRDLRRFKEPLATLVLLMALYNMPFIDTMLDVEIPRDGKECVEMFGVKFIERPVWMISKEEIKRVEAQMYKNEMDKIQQIIKADRQEAQQVLIKSRSAGISEFATQQYAHSLVISR
jgi:hypothetical protein